MVDRVRTGTLSILALVTTYWVQSYVVRSARARHLRHTAAAKLASRNKIRDKQEQAQPETQGLTDELRERIIRMSAHELLEAMSSGELTSVQV